VIKNYGNLPLTTLDIIYDINGGTPITFPWAGNLTPGQAATVTLSNISYVATASNTVNISVANPNGNTDQNTTNDNVTTTFINQSMQGQVTTGINSGLATIDITTDGYPTESTWEIIDDNGTVIASGSPTTANAPQAQATATLIAGTCYAFNMYDSYGDGLSDPANGSYDVKDASGTSIASGGGNFGFLAEHYFETSGGAAASWDCDIVNGCIDPGTGTGLYTSLGSCTSVCNTTSIQDNNTSEFNIYPNPVKNVLTITGDYSSANIYDVFGKLVLTSQTQKTIDVSTLSNGVYFVNINTENTITVKKITIAK